LNTPCTVLPITHAASGPKEKKTRDTSASQNGGITIRELSNQDRWTLDDLDEMIMRIPRLPYEDWLRCCSGAWSEFGEAATPILAAHWPEEKKGEYADKFANRLNDITFGTVVHYAKMHGWQPDVRQQNIIKAAKEALASADPETPDLAEAFYYDGSRYYLDTAREFVPMDQKSVSRHMRERLVEWFGSMKNNDKRKPAKDGEAAKIWGMTEAALCRIQRERHINYSGPLAGHRRGLHTAGGVKLLATVSPAIIEAAERPWATLQAVIENLLGDPEAGDVQISTFMAWLKIARESLLTNRPRPGQAVAFAGPRGCGKTLLIDILELALGGRRSNPYPHFTGRTNFNADLAGAELLAVDDEAGSTDIRSRRALAANIKCCLFSGAVRIEGKHRCAFTFRPCWRMVMALNDEPEALLVLPPITEDITDKITLFRCHKKPLPMPAHTLEERDAFFATLRAELPGMLAWLETWDIPSELREERCGVLAYHHPAILAALLELSPEGQLAGLVDSACAVGMLPLPWEGTAAALKGILTACPQTSRDAEKLLGSWHAAAGAYLARLEGERVERLPMLNGVHRWRVLPSGLVY
jgi:hypothetical protein